MDKLLILNASPRAPKSNSKRYAQLFANACPAESVCRNVNKNNHAELIGAMEECSDLLFVFPLYADALPVGFLEFLKVLEVNPPARRPVISILINCGFLEPAQNDVAIDMVRLFCAQNGYDFGSVLKIGSGEASLDTPFAAFARAKIKKLALCIAKGKKRTLTVSMPLPKQLFLRASRPYWENYGRKNGVTKEEMSTMRIEGE